MNKDTKDRELEELTDRIVNMGLWSHVMTPREKAEEIQKVGYRKLSNLINEGYTKHPFDYKKKWDELIEFAFSEEIQNDLFALDKILDKIKELEGGG